jgi:mxaL protein
VEDAVLEGAPASRLDFAREAARQALRELPCGSRVGWAAFTEYRTLLLLAPIEVCENYNDLLATLAEIDGRIRWGNASEVAKGVFWALRAAKELRGKPAILVLTDGLESPPLTAFPRGDDVQPGQVRGWLLGIGAAVPQPIPRTDAEGNRIGYWRAVDVLQRNVPAGQPPSREHLSELREPHLRSLAAQTGLGYSALHEPAELARRAQVPTDLRAVPALLALVLLCVYFRPDAFAARRPRLSRTSGT